MAALRGLRARWNDAAIILKLRMLWLYRGHMREWYRDVWQQKVYDYMCCSGRECGCYGACFGDWWEHLLKREEPTQDTAAGGCDGTA